MRAALRLRREDARFDHDSGAFTGVFEYFVAFGDRSDLAWMEAALSRLDTSRQSFGREYIQKLRERLSRQ